MLGSLNMEFGDQVVYMDVGAWFMRGNKVDRLAFLSTQIF